MTRLLTIGAMLGVAGLALLFAVPAAAQRGDKADAKTPDSWNYEIRNGRRVPKGKRVTAADGSWREEIKDGDCVLVRERTADGEYRETRSCWAPVAAMNET